jgi:MtN3 and saliva related transmembrane protein
MRREYHGHAARALLLALHGTRPIVRAPLRERALPVIDPLATLAAAWGVLMAVAPLLQIRRMLVRRSSADVSIAYLGVLQVGFTLWVAYGISLANLALIIPNATAFTVGIVTILVAWRFRRRAFTRNDLSAG